MRIYTNSLGEYQCDHCKSTNVLVWQTDTDFADKVKCIDCAKAKSGIYAVIALRFKYGQVNRKHKDFEIKLRRPIAKLFKWLRFNITNKRSWGVQCMYTEQFIPKELL